MGDYEELERIAKDVLRDFENGNIEDATRAVSKMPPLAAAWIGAYIFAQGVPERASIASESFWMRCLAARVDIKPTRARFAFGDEEDYNWISVVNGWKCSRCGAVVRAPYKEPHVCTEDQQS